VVRIVVSAEPEPRPDEWKRPFVGLIAVVTCVFIGFGSVIPVLPRVVTSDLSAGRLAVGAVFAISGAVALFARPFVGRAAQRLGSRRVVRTGALLAVAVGLAYLVPARLGGSGGLAFLLAVRVLMGAAEATVFTGGSVGVVALAPADRRGQLVGWYGLAMWSGWALGPLIGDGIDRGIGSDAVWWFAGGTALLGAAIATTLPDFGATTGAAPSTSLVPRSVLMPGSALALAAVGYAALQGFVVLHLAARGTGHGSLVLTAFAAAYVGVRLVASQVPDRFGAGRIAVVCGLGEAVGLVLIGVAHGLPLGIAGGVVAGAGFAVLYPALALIVLDRTPVHDRGTAIGAYTSFWDLGLAVGGLATGAVARVDLPSTFFLAAAAAVATAALGAKAAMSSRRTVVA
jgi:MFS family permease